MVLINSFGKAGFQISCPKYSTRNESLYFGRHFVTVCNSNCLLFYVYGSALSVIWVSLKNVFFKRVYRGQCWAPPPPPPPPMHKQVWKWPYALLRSAIDTVSSNHIVRCKTISLGQSQYANPSNPDRQMDRVAKSCAQSRVIYLFPLIYVFR